MRLACLCFLALVACGDDSAPRTDGGRTDAGSDAGSGPLPLDTVRSGGVGLYPTEPREGTCDFRGGSGSTATDACSGETSAYFFVSRIDFPLVEIRAGERNRVVGFDLDGVDSDGSLDDGGCGNRDYVSLDGRFGGVDNQGAALVPAIDSILTEDLETTAETAIAEGRFGVLIELRHWNGTGDDDCVDVLVHQAVPSTDLELDATGAPVGGQSFDLEGPPRVFIDETLVGGELRADLGGFPVPQPFMMDLQSAHLRLRWDGTTFDGVVTGDMPSALVVATLACREERIPPEVLESILVDVSDLRPTEGVCEGVSWAFEITTVDAQLAP